MLSRFLESTPRDSDILGLWRGQRICYLNNVPVDSDVPLGANPGTIWWLDVNGHILWQIVTQRGPQILPMKWSWDRGLNKIIGSGMWRVLGKPHFNALSFCVILSEQIQNLFFIIFLVLAIERALHVC